MNVVYVAQCALGRGLFAGQDFAPGDEIIRFSGPLITLAEALAKGDEQGNPLQVGDELYLDIEPPGMLANHSCEPNAGIIKDRVLIALRPILAGEEVRYDYSTTMWEGIWTMRCSCGASQCRGVIGDFPELPAELRAKYLRQRVVQGFILHRLRAAGLA